MSEYIDRESIRKVLMDVCSDENCPMFIAATIDQVIDYEPAADVAPVVHAYWKRVDKDDGGHDTVCSHCSTPIVTYLETPYCHNCGAKMDGGVTNGEDN
jgi:hypothetical protein